MQSILKNNQLRFFWSAIGAIAGAGLNLLSARGANTMNDKIQRENMAMQRDINAQNIQLQKDMNAYNDPASQLQRLRDAGINPSFMSGDSIAPGNQTTVPSLTAPQNMMTATVPDLGSPIASGFANLGSERAQMAAAVLSKEGAKKTIAETSAIEYQLMLDKKFKEPQYQAILRQFDQEFAKGTEELNHLRELVTSQQLDNARKEIENRYVEIEKDYNIEFMKQQYHMNEEQIKNLVQDTALKLAQTDLADSQKAFQDIINKLRKDYPMAFLSGQAGNGVAGLIGMCLDCLGFDKEVLQQKLSDLFNVGDHDGPRIFGFGRKKKKK